jgi:hypothetical protein
VAALRMMVVDVEYFLARLDLTTHGCSEISGEVGKESQIRQRQTNKFSSSWRPLQLVVERSRQMAVSARGYRVAVDTVEQEVHLVVVSRLQDCEVGLLVL